MPEDGLDSAPGGAPDSVFGAHGEAARCAAAGGRGGAWPTWRLHTLQGRLLWSVALVLMLALGGLGLRTAIDASRRLQQEETAHARALARSVALTIINPLLTRQFDQVEESLLRLALLPGLRELSVTDADGRLISRAHVPAAGEPIPMFGDSVLEVPRTPQPVVHEEHRPDGTRTLVAWHPVGGATPVGWVQAVHALDQLEALQREVVVRTVGAAAAAALLGCVLLLWLLHAPLASLRAAAQFARRMRRVDGAQMVAHPGALHETRALVASLNSTSRRLAAQARAIGQAMAQAQQHGQALDQRNRELDAILAISPNGLLALDAQGLVLFVSAAMGRYTGLEPLTLVGRPLAAFERALRERCGVPAEWPGFEGTFAQPGTGGLPLLTLAHPERRDLRLERGRVDAAGIAWLISAQDVTHEHEVERLKSEFLTTAAHELRTPMVSVHGFTELLLQRQLPPEKQRPMLEAVHRNSTRMNLIINEMLDLARIEARRGVDFVREALDLQALVVESMPDFRAPEGRASPVVRALPVPLPVQGDPDKIRRVLFNLLSNAFKYSGAPGQVTVQMLCEPAAAEGVAPRVGFAIADEGIGMTPEQLARVFERFYRADPSGTVLGTGLGMAIVQEIVQLHGGQVLVTSRAGHGTTVTVWMPRAVAASAARAVAEETVVA